MTKLFLVSSALLLASASPVLAQTPRPTPRPAAPAQTQAPASATIQTRADELTTNMAQGLGLTPAQTEKVRAINVKSVRNLEAARARYRQEPTKLRSYIDDIGLARLEELKEVLTPAQFQRYQQKREEKMGIPKGGGIQGNQPPGLGGRGEE